MEPTSRGITTQMGRVALTVNTLLSDPMLQFAVRTSEGTVGVYLTEEEARELAKNLILAADDYGDEVVRRGEQHDEMRLQA